MPKSETEKKFYGVIDVITSLESSVEMEIKSDDFPDIRRRYFHTITGDGLLLAYASEDKGKEPLDKYLEAFMADEIHVRLV